MERFCWLGSSSGFVHVEMSTNSNMGMRLQQSSFLTVELTSESPGGLVKAQLLSPSPEFLIQVRGGPCEFAFALIPSKENAAI